MRAIVISSPDRPVEVLEIPQRTSELELAVVCQHLDAVGVEFEVLPVSRNSTVEELRNDVDRFIDLDDDQGLDPEGP
jgi:hypothetical protein